MKSRRKPPTKAESRRMGIIKRDIGCIVTRLEQGVYAPCEIHHLLDTGSRRGHSFTIGLTYEHHQGGNGTHRAKLAFRDAHGSDDYLLAATNRLYEEFEASIIGGAA